MMKEEEQEKESFGKHTHHLFIITIVIHAN